MLQLFLSEAKWADGNGNDESSNWRKSLLDELEIVIWSLMASEGRSEARLWLCNTLSGIRSIRPRCQQELFVCLLRSVPVKQYLASQLLQLIFEKWPQKVGPIIAKKVKPFDFIIVIPIFSLLSSLTCGSARAPFTALLFNVAKVGFHRYEVDADPFGVGLQ
ncbi:hypothetical protein F511_29776 [Dorcoceras hygrometricum]|uniref:Uncharacterized protein n=1 Tax=Dorcoceras hygrometricum TaxID=472368 RepID=A0A2Z7BJQ2_9LAMI|nr:hypothetical protein F511_29776 [Dorcoceras hygrometricum]